MPPIRWQSFAQHCAIVCAAVSLAACGTVSGPKPADTRSPDTRSAQRGGGYYLDDGPGNDIPANIDSIPDAVPRPERLHRGTSRPYTVMGRSYTPMTDLVPYRSRGVATWYGRRYHGQRTASGEIYDMYAMTAAHTTLPIPSYARVTNVNNGRSVVVKINDRGPFIGDRLIDLSYVAAHRLDLLRSGSGMVEVETILPTGDASAPAQARPASTRAIAAEPPQATATVASVATASPAPTAPAPAAATAALVPRAGGLYLQLGAFSLPENAQRFMDRVRSQFGDTGPTLTMQPANQLFRVQSGPYATRADAMEAAERIGQVLGETPILAGPR